MKIKVGLDFGFGDIKYAIEIEGKEYTGKFPSVIKEKTMKNSLNGFASKPNHVVMINENLYYVGEQAIIEDGEREWEEEIYKHTKFRELIDSAIAIAFGEINISPSEVIVESLMIALPLKHYLRMKDTKKKEVRNIFQKKSEIKKDNNEFTLLYKEQNVNFTGQGYISAIYLDAVNRQKTGSSLIGTLYFGDIGYKTYDEFLIISDGEKVRVKETSINTSSDGGVRYFYQAIADEMANKLSVDEIPIKKIKQCLKSRTFLHRGKDMSEMFKEVCSKAINEVVNLYTSTIRKSTGENGLNSLTGIFMLGGGSEIFGNEVLDMLDFAPMIKDEDLSMLNAKGCLLLAQNV